MDPKAAGFFVLFALFIVVFPTLVLRYRRLELRHQEKMAAFEKGAPVPLETADRPATVETYQLRGLVWLAAGIALSIVLYLVMPLAASDSAATRLYREQDMKRAGFTYDEIRDTMQDYDRRADRTRAYAALGLVPAAVGAAYLFFYYEQRRRYVYDPPVQPVKME
jgi:hypothetical protein